jgi:hypothetical protein
LFIEGGVQTYFLAEESTKLINEMDVPTMLEDENICVDDDTTTYILGFSTLEST